MSAEVFTLLLLGPEARLLDGRGSLLASHAGPPAQWRLGLPRGAAVQLILGGPGLDLRCQEVPALTARECRDVHLRQLAAAGSRELRQAAEFLDDDSGADGGHVLWLASCPRRDLDAWLDLLLAEGLRPLRAVPWQRAFLAAAQQPAGRDGLFLALDGAAGRLLFYQGRSLRYLREFPLAPGLLGDGPELAAALAVELARLLQFLRQRYRAGEVAALAVVGLPAGPAPELVSVAKALGLELANLAPDLAGFLLDGAARERRRGLDLVPIELHQARQRRAFRTVVRGALAALALLCAGAKAVLLRHERGLQQEAARAELAAAQRLAYAKEGEEAARLRFPLLRVRWAEARQKMVLEDLEGLGLKLLQAPPEVRLERVEIQQTAAEPVAERFTVAGAALTRDGFSMGPLTQYFADLAAFPGVKLDPLQDVAVVDAGQGERREQAMTRFAFAGVAP